LLRSGWYDPLIQNKAYLDFATNAPGYGQLQSDDVLAQMNDSYFRPGGCLDQEQACFDAGNSSASNRICATADDFCVRSFPHPELSSREVNPLMQVENLFIPAVGDRDSDDLRQNASGPVFPPEFYVSFLRERSVMTAIGAEARYSECPDAPFELFTRTGDVCSFARQNTIILTFVTRTQGPSCPSSAIWQTLG